MRVFVPKLGSDVTSGKEGIDYESIERISEEIAGLPPDVSVAFVHGGAVNTGRNFIRANEEKLKDRGINIAALSDQEIAGLGTSSTHGAFQNELAKYGIPCVQALIEQSQMVKGSVFMQGVVHGLGNRVVYAINENDQVNVFELLRQAQEEAEHEEKIKAEPEVKRVKKDDAHNDPLAAGFARALVEEMEEEGKEADVSLALLTSVGGFLIDGIIQPEVSVSNRDFVLRNCRGVRKGGSGGMKAKMEAAFYAFEAGVDVSIAHPTTSFKDIIEHKPINGTRVVK